MARGRKIGDLRGLDGADHRAQRRAHQLLEQALLVAEVEINRALGDAGAARDIVEAGRSEARGGEFFERRREDRIPPLGLARGPDLARRRWSRRDPTPGTPRPHRTFQCLLSGHFSPILND